MFLQRRVPDHALAALRIQQTLRPHLRRVMLLSSRYNAVRAMLTAHEFPLSKERLRVVDEVLAPALTSLTWQVRRRQGGTGTAVRDGDGAHLAFSFASCRAPSWPHRRAEALATILRALSIKCPD